MLIEETVVGDPLPLNPNFDTRKSSQIRPSAEESLYELTDFIKISRGIARYENEICLENINLEVRIVRFKYKS